MSGIKCGNCGGYHPSISGVYACHASATSTRPTQTRKPVSPGWYEIYGVVYKVQKAVHGSGYMYAKKLHVYDQGEAKWIYAPGEIRNIRPEHKLTKERAIELGKIYGRILYMWSHVNR